MKLSFFLSKGPNPDQQNQVAGLGARKEDISLDRQWDKPQFHFNKFGGGIGVEGGRNTSL